MPDSPMTQQEYAEASRFVIEYHKNPQQFGPKAAALAQEYERKIAAFEAPIGTPRDESGMPIKQEAPPVQKQAPVTPVPPTRKVEDTMKQLGFVRTPQEAAQYYNVKSPVGVDISVPPAMQSSQTQMDTQKYATFQKATTINDLIGFTTIGGKPYAVIHSRGAFSKTGSESIGITSLAELPISQSEFVTKGVEELKQKPEIIGGLISENIKIAGQDWERYQAPSGYEKESREEYLNRVRENLTATFTPESFKPQFEEQYYKQVSEGIKIGTFPTISKAEYIKGEMIHDIKKGGIPPGLAITSRLHNPAILFADVLGQKEIAKQLEAETVYSYGELGKKGALAGGFKSLTESPIGIFAITGGIGAGVGAGIRGVAMGGQAIKYLGYTGTGIAATTAGITYGAGELKAGELERQGMFEQAARTRIETYGILGKEAVGFGGFAVGAKGGYTAMESAFQKATKVSVTTTSSGEMLSFPKGPKPTEIKTSYYIAQEKPADIVELMTGKTSLRQLDVVPGKTSGVLIPSEPMKPDTIAMYKELGIQGIKKGDVFVGVTEFPQAPTVKTKFDIPVIRPATEKVVVIKPITQMRKTLFETIPLKEGEPMHYLTLDIAAGKTSKLIRPDTIGLIKGYSKQRYRIPTEEIGTVKKTGEEYKMQIEKTGFGLREVGRTKIRTGKIISEKRVGLFEIKNIKSMEKVPAYAPEDVDRLERLNILKELPRPLGDRVPSLKKSGKTFSMDRYLLMQELPKPSGEVSILNIKEQLKANKIMQNLQDIGKQYVLDTTLTPKTVAKPLTFGFAGLTQKPVEKQKTELERIYKKPIITQIPSIFPVTKEKMITAVSEKPKEFAIQTTQLKFGELEREKLRQVQVSRLAIIPIEKTKTRLSFPTPTLRIPETPLGLRFKMPSGAPSLSFFRKGIEKTTGIKAKKRAKGKPEYIPGPISAVISKFSYGGITRPKKLSEAYSKIGFAVSPTKELMKRSVYLH